jgi:hypothetical protein
MRKLIGLLAFSAATLGASTAFAQMENFGKAGSMGFSAERLFGFYSLHLSNEDPNPNNPNRDDTLTGFGLGIGADSYPFNIPRLGFDIFVIDQLSVGGAIGYASYSDANQNNNSQFGNNSVEVFELAPRVGYWIPLGSIAGFWPRGGFTWHSINPDGPDNDARGLALTLEALFGIGPVEHFAFLLGPLFDIDIIGNRDCRRNLVQDTCGSHYRNIGIDVGIMGWF